MDRLIEESRRIYERHRLYFLTSAALFVVLVFAYAGIDSSVETAASLFDAQNTVQARQADAGSSTPAVFSGELADQQGVDSNEYSSDRTKIPLHATVNTLTQQTSELDVDASAVITVTDRLVAHGDELLNNFSPETKPVVSASDPAVVKRQQSFSTLQTRLVRLTGASVH